MEDRNNKPVVNLISKPENMLKTVYTACRTCYSADSPSEIYDCDSAQDEEKMLKLIKKVISSGHYSTIEHIQVDISPMDYLDKTHVILAYRNITEQVNETREKMAESRTDEILRAVSMDYVFLLEIDLDTEKEKHYFVYTDKRFEIPEWSKSNDFRECVLDYANEFVAPHDRDRFREETNLDSLKKRLANENCFTLSYDVVIRGKARRFQGRFVMQTNEYDSDKIFVSTRDITPN